MKLTADKIKRRYNNNHYISFTRYYDYSDQCYYYDNIKTYKTIRENTTRISDLETAQEFTR